MLRRVLIIITIVIAGLIYFVESASLETDMVYIKKCNHTSPISLRTINEVLINKKLSNQNEADGFMCFMHCLFMMYGWMDDEGGFNLHTMKANLNEAQTEINTIEFVLYKCTAIQSVDRCERAFKFLQCFWETMEEQEKQKRAELDYSRNDEAFKRFIGGSRDIIMK